MRTRTLSLVMLGSALATALGAAVVAGPAQASTPSTPTYYVSVGDSYAVGYQPGHGATKGYAGYVAGKTHLKLVNFGCGGATTTSILQTVGCPDVLPHTAGGTTYPTTTQIAAADAFIAANKGHIGLITSSIGGNDVTACATQANPCPAWRPRSRASTPTSRRWPPTCATPPGRASRSSARPIPT